MKTSRIILLVLVLAYGVLAGACSNGGASPTAPAFQRQGVEDGSLQSQGGDDGLVAVSFCDQPVIEERSVSRCD